MSAPATSKRVVINRVALTGAEIDGLERQYGVQLAEGDFWYDKNCGAWGREGGPTMGFVLPGISVGGPLRADASAGDASVFINGRQLHALDVLGLQSFMPVLPGRFWVDAYWNGGYEGGPAFFNIAQMMRATGRGGSGGAWSSTTKHFTQNTNVTGDGAGFIHVSGKNSSGDPWTYCP